MIRYLTYLMTLALLAGCAARPVPEDTADNAAVFQHDIEGTVRPWSHEAFDDGPGKFTFALFSDLTGGEREDVYNVAVAQLRLLRPELILNVGDLIEGGTRDRSQLAREWDDFEHRSSRTRAPVFYTGGNHDLTNPVMWSVWEERYGRRYYHFIYKNTLFLVMDTEDNPPEFQESLARIRDESLAEVAEQGWDAFPDTEYGRTTERRSGRVGARQAAYFRDVIARFPAVRHTFVLLHKPAWTSPGEQNFATVETALADRPYTVFYGHEHSYLYEQRHGRDYIRLATTGGVQNLKKPHAYDHVTLVTVSGSDVDIANLRLSGILGKDGRIPAGGDDLCFEARVCGAP